MSFWTRVGPADGLDWPWERKDSHRGSAPPTLSAVAKSPPQKGPDVPGSLTGPQKKQQGQRGISCGLRGPAPCSCPLGVSRLQPCHLKSEPQIFHQSQFPKDAHLCTPSPGESSAGLVSKAKGSRWVRRKQDETKPGGLVPASSPHRHCRLLSPPPSV